MQILWQHLPCSGNQPCRNMLRVAIIITIIVFCFLNTAAWADNHEDAPAPLKELRFAALQGIYPNISRNDGRMALELLMQKTIIKKNYPYKVKLLFIDQQTGIVNAIKEGDYHFVTLSGIDYFKYRDKVHLEPILIPSKIDQPTERLLFLIGKDQTLASIRQKEERSLIIEKGTNGDLSKLWLDTLLMGHGFQDSDRFFTKIRRINKPTRAVLPVFFTQADACVVTANALEVLKELNPQIVERIKTLHQSKALIRLMICATAKPSRPEIDILIRESTNIAHNTDTRQAMTILQMKRFIRVHPEDLTATQELLLHHAKITRNQSKAQ